MSWARNSVGERGDNIGLPDVTTADNGKIMEVEAGEWKLKEGSGGGGGIPAPASPSDGDVLTYDSDTSAWVAAAPSGGGGVTCISITIDEQNNRMVLGATYAEIEALMTAGSFFIFKQISEGEIDYHYVSYIWEGDGEHDSPYNVVLDSNMDFYCTLKSEYPVSPM